jgi:hypothetical protein
MDEGKIDVGEITAPDGLIRHTVTVSMVSCPRGGSLPWLAAADHEHSLQPP